jgi:hypothetical protein
MAEVTKVDGEEPTTNSFAEVAKADEEQRAAARAAPPPDPVAEGVALKALFANEEACATCEDKLGGRWSSCCLDKYRAGWDSAGDKELGAEILRVVDTLDASHLLPSGISERLGGGNAAASFGLATLMGNMQAPTSQ